MKILVFSDTHRCIQHMLDAIDIQQPDCIIHLGDHITDTQQISRQYPLIPLICVPGNCDCGSNEPEQIISELEGVRFFITHGHRHGVKTNLMRLSYAAMEANASVALFGHTHIPGIHAVNDYLTLFNPGSCGALSATYGVITLENQVPDFKIVP